MHVLLEKAHLYLRTPGISRWLFSIWE